jgi:hypothetical protein
LTATWTPAYTLIQTTKMMVNGEMMAVRHYSRLHTCVTCAMMTHPVLAAAALPPCTLPADNQDEGEQYEDDFDDPDDDGEASTSSCSGQSVGPLGDTSDVETDLDTERQQQTDQERAVADPLPGDPSDESLHAQGIIATDVSTAGAGASILSEIAEALAAAEAAADAAAAPEASGVSVAANSALLSRSMSQEITEALAAAEAAGEAAVAAGSSTAAAPEDAAAAADVLAEAK